jgi:hypothetical protein
MHRIDPDDCHSARFDPVAGDGTVLQQAATLRPPVG